MIYLNNCLLKRFTYAAQKKWRASTLGFSWCLTLNEDRKLFNVLLLFGSVANTLYTFRSKRYFVLKL